MEPREYDFGGYATRYNVKCSDGRTILPEAFKDADGQKVPIVYHHIHDDIENILGHAILENRADGMYAYCTLNNSEKGQAAKEVVKHGDVMSLSIYANKLKERAGSVLHGVIREVSLVLSGANPGATIDTVAFGHGDDFIPSETDVIISSGISPDVEPVVEHACAPAAKDEKKKLEHEDPATKEKDTGMAQEKTVQDVFDSMTDEQKAVVDVLVGAAIEGIQNGELDVEDGEMQQSGFGGSMSYNVFENQGEEYGELQHADVDLIFDEMRRGSSLKEAMLAHSITNVEVLFPEARVATSTPETITRQMEWVSEVLGSVRKSPFSRVKTTAINITADEARAKGYIKGREKAEEVIVALKRVTTPQTIYKKQAMDRDDVVDIVDFDVIAYINAEMRVMLNEEVARAVLVGDGRSSSSENKINPLNIRPIWGDDALYVTNTIIELAPGATDEDKAKKLIDEIIKQRKNYKGSGRPVAYLGTDVLTLCRLIKDSQGYRRYKTDQELADDLRVAKIVEVELFDGLSRTDASKTYDLGAVLVNLMDYTLGADKGGEVTNFEDFDIDFNKHKYLIETRVSGALTKPKSALTFEFHKPTQG